MKILVVHEVNYLAKIIYEFQILPEILSLLGHEITVIDYNDNWRNEANGRRVNLRTSVSENVHRAYPQASVTVRRPGMIRVPVISRISGAITAGMEVAKVLKHDTPDVILLYGLPTVGLQTLWAARRFKVPVIFRAIDVTHELVPSAALAPMTKVLEKVIFNSVRFNIALTPHLRSYICSYGVPEDRVRLLPSGVDAEMFSPGPRNNEYLKQWGIEADDPVVLFMGTIYRFSGLDRVISGYPKLLARHPRAKLLVVGSGDDESRLRALASERGVAANVVFTGMQPYGILPEVIRSSEVCINPFELNGITRNILPTKLFQYMICCKPVLATPLPGAVTFLSGEKDGIVYASLDEFNERLSDLLSNRERRIALGECGHKVASQYNWRTIAQTMVSWLEEVA